MAKPVKAISDGKPGNFGSSKNVPKSKKEIYLTFLIPIVVQCAMFIANFALDFVVAVQHFREKNPIWGWCTLAIMYCPAIVYFVLTVSRPDWYMTDDDKATKGTVHWYLRQFLQLVAFPLFALYRYAAQIVLTVEAILLTGEERTKTLNIVVAPAAIELYFFLQAWFQAAPQAVFQTHLLFREQTITRTFQSEIVQVLSMIVSIAIIAKITATFRRYESQRINGKKLPWAMWYQKYKIQEVQNVEEEQPLRAVTTNTSSENVLLIENQEAPSKELGKRIVLQRQDSETPPLPPKNAQVIPPPMPLRNITTIKPLTVPDMPAPPRPDSIADPENPENVVSETEKAEENSSQSKSTLRLPQRTSTQGLGRREDDKLAIVAFFFWWFFFIFARVLSIAVFFRFFPIYLAGVLGVHYVFMIAYLFFHSKYFDFASFFLNLWLGLVYIFCIIEYRIKFQHTGKWLVVYYSLVLIENSGMSLIWYYIADWRNASTFLTVVTFKYIFYAIFASMTICIISMLIYYFVLKPRRRKIYVT